MYRIYRLKWSLYPNRRNYFYSESPQLWLELDRNLIIFTKNTSIYQKWNWQSLLIHRFLHIYRNSRMYSRMQLRRHLWNRNKFKRNRGSGYLTLNFTMGHFSFKQQYFWLIKIIMLEMHFQLFSSYIWKQIYNWVVKAD